MGIELRQTSGEMAYKIAKSLNLPWVTVDTVIKAYVQELKESALTGHDVVINGLFRINMYKTEDGLVARGAVSASLRDKLKGVKELGIIDRGRGVTI